MKNKNKNMLHIISYQIKMKKNNNMYHCQNLKNKKNKNKMKIKKSLLFFNIYQKEQNNLLKKCLNKNMIIN